MRIYLLLLLLPLPLLLPSVYAACRCASGRLSCRASGLAHLPSLSCPQASRLDLSHNHLSSLPPSAFASLPNLRRLYLANNALTLLDPATFAAMPLLRRLDLSYNALTTVPSFRVLPQLAYLLLMGNKLTTVPAISAPRLTKLNLDANNLSHVFFSPDFQRCRALRSVSLTSNKISSLSRDSFFNLRSLGLVSLDLDANPLSSIHPSAFIPLLPTLQTLSLNNCRLSPANLTALIRVLGSPSSVLSTLRLQGNSLPSLDADLLSDLANISLQHLFLDQRRYQSVHPDVFRPVQATLTTLGLSSCHLGRKLDGVDLSRFPKLRVLKLDKNEMKELPARLPASLRRLYLRDNAIRALPEAAFEGLKFLTVLDLRENRFHSLSVSTLPKSDLRLLMLNGNPLRCDCSVVPLLQWLRSRPMLDKTLQTKCGGTVVGAGKRLEDVKEVKECVEATTSTARPPVVVTSRSPTTSTSTSDISNISAIVSHLKPEVPQKPRDSTPFIAAIVVFTSIVVIVSVVVALVMLRRLQRRGRPRSNPEKVDEAVVCYDGYKLLTPGSNHSRNSTTSFSNHRFHSDPPREREEPVGAEVTRSILIMHSSQDVEVGRDILTAAPCPCRLLAWEAAEGTRLEDEDDIVFVASATLSEDKTAKTLLWNALNRTRRPIVLLLPDAPSWLHDFCRGFPTTMVEWQVGQSGVERLWREMEVEDR